MESGYVFVHVLEAEIPGKDLGDSHVCEISVGDVVFRCQIPTTRSSDSLQLPIVGDPSEVVIIARIFEDSGAEQAVGSIVVPVSTLEPMEAWSVWYAMDNGSEDTHQLPPDESMGKMHVLLQRVSQEVADTETAEAREVRAQEFLLRALQQLNSSLETQVMTSSVSRSESVNGAVDDVIADGLLHGSSVLSLPPSKPSSRTASVTPPRTESKTPPAPLTPPNSATGKVGADPLPPKPLEPPASSAHDIDDAPDLRGAPLGQGSPEVEALVQQRVAPLVHLIESLEERQQLFDEQEVQIQELTTALRAGEAETAALKQQLTTLQQKTSSQTTNGSSHSGPDHPQLASLQRETAARKVHEETLQRRVTLLEGELTLARQKCLVLDSLHQQVEDVSKELECEREARQLCELQLHEQRRRCEDLTGELQVIRQQGKAYDQKIEAELASSRRQVESVQKAAQEYRNQLRDQDADSKALHEEMMMLKCQVSLLQGEAASNREMFERERKCRQDLEQRFQQEELAPFKASLEEYRRTILQLQEALASSQRDAVQEAGRAHLSAKEAEVARHELEEALVEKEDLKRQLASQADMMQRSKELQDRWDDIQAEVTASQQGVRRMVEHYEVELKQYAKADEALSKELSHQHLTIERQQATIGDLEASLAALKRRMQELQSSQHHAEQQRPPPVPTSRQTVGVPRQHRTFAEKLRPLGRPASQGELRTSRSPSAAKT